MPCNIGSWYVCLCSLNSGVFMIQYIREFALKNTVRVIFELFTYWNWGLGLELELACKFVQFCRPLANDFQLANEV